MRRSIRVRGAVVFQIVVLIFLPIAMSACFAKPDIPQASTSNFESANPLRISKEEANRIKVVAITTFPLINAMVPPMPMTGMGSINTSANSVALLTDNISSRGRFQLVPPNEFRKKLVESKETFDRTLTQSEVQAIAQKVGKSLGADAVIIVEMDNQQAGATVGPAALGPAFQAGWTGTTTQVQTIKMSVISSNSSDIIWQQILKRNITHRIDGSQSDEVGAPGVIAGKCTVRVPLRPP